jgi:anti-anti-sigma factor
VNDHGSNPLPRQYGDERCRAEVSYDGTTAIVTVIGEADQSTAPTLGAGIEEAISLRPERAVVDLLGVSFLASAAIRELIVGHRALGERFVVVAGNRNTLRPLVELALDRLFRIVDNVAEAVAAPG